MDGKVGRSQTSHRAKEFESNGCKAARQFISVSICGDGDCQWCTGVQGAPLKLNKRVRWGARSVLAGALM